ncbi:SpaA isopeptide-forming pilin-related protein, partial [Lactococcus petauri]
MNLKKKKKLQKDLMESKVTHFSKRKRGKTWVYGSMIVFTLLGTALQSSGVLVQAMGQATPDSNIMQDVKAKSSDSEATPIVGEDKNLDNTKMIQQNSKISKLELPSLNNSARTLSNGTISVHTDNPYAFDAAGKSLEYLQKEHPGTNNPWLTFPLTNTGAVTEGNAPGRVYCLDEASPLNPGASATTSNTGSGSVGADWASLKPLQRAQLQWIGWLSFNNTKASAATDDAMYFAAQMIIWDIANGDGFPSSAAASENHPANVYTQNLNGGHQSYQAIMDDMDYLIDQYNSSIKLPKFAQSEKTIILGQTAKFSDSNGVLHNYNKITATNRANATVSGNMLSVKPTKAGVSTITLDNGGISEDGPNANKGGVQVWFTNNTDGTPGQNVLYSANHPQANVKVKVNVIPAASIKITKMDSDSGKIIPGTKFILLNKEGKQVTKDADGKALPNGGEFTTGADGTVTINNLMADPENLAGGEAQTPATIRETYVPAPYTLSNNLVVVVNPDGTAKKPSTDLPIKVVPGTTASNPTGVTFSDKKQVQAIKVEKTNSLSGNTNITDNYSLAGATFEIKDKTKGTVVGNLVTDKNGLADMASSQYVELLNQMEVDDTYTIQEVQAPSGLAITWNDGKPKEFTLKYSGDDSQLVNPD